MMTAAYVVAPVKYSSLNGQRIAYVAPKVSQKNRCTVQVRAEAPATSGIEKSGPNFTALKDIEEIMKILPHRYDYNYHSIKIHMRHAQCTMLARPFHHKKSALTV